MAKQACSLPAVLATAILVVGTAAAQFGGSPGVPPGPGGYGEESCGGCYAAPPMARPRAKPDGRITLELSDGSRLIGKPADLDDIKIEASFGEISVPRKQVRGILIVPSQKAEENAVLLFENDDVLTGRLLVEAIELEAVWGTTKIDAAHIKSLVNSSLPAEWHFDGRWRLSLPGEMESYPSPPGTGYGSPYPSGAPGGYGDGGYGPPGGYGPGGSPAPGYDSGAYEGGAAGEPVPAPSDGPPFRGESP